MKRLLVVLALTPILILAMAASPAAKILPDLDNWNPLLGDGDRVDDGGVEEPDDDHPWGGDRSSGDFEEDSSDRIRVLSTMTGNWMIDLVMNSYYLRSLRLQSLEQYQTSSSSSSVIYQSRTQTSGGSSSSRYEVFK